MFPSATLFEIASIPFKRSQLGLFHGKTKLYGNNNPFSKKKTRRTWLPNIQNKRVFSETLQETLKVTLTMKAMRTMKKYGGFDNYILKTKHTLLGHEGMRLRLKLLEAQGVYSKPKEDEADEMAKIKRRERTLLKLRRAIRSPIYRAAYIQEKHKLPADEFRLRKKEKRERRKKEKRKEVDVSLLPSASGDEELAVAAAAAVAS